MIKNIAVEKLSPNEGQIEGLPKNPRFIRDEQFEKLKLSLQEFPEMLNLRELIVFPQDNQFIIVAGNMRYRAGKELGLKEFPCKVLPQDTTIERLKEITIKDNNNFGEWDFDELVNEWDSDVLTDWGIDVPKYDNTDLDIDDFLSSQSTEQKEDNFVLNISFPKDIEDKREEIVSKITSVLEGYIFKIK